MLLCRRKQDAKCTSMKDRIHDIMTSKGFTQTTFATKLGISAASLSSIFTGRTRPTSNHVAAIHREFPEVSISWLMFGEGDMLNSAADGGTTASESDNSEVLQTTVVEDDAAAATSTRNSQDTTVNAKPAGKVNKQTSYEPQQAFMSGSVKNPDTKQRHIKEIRIFFDDGTYEVFAGNQ